MLNPLSKGDKFGNLRLELETKGFISSRAAEREPTRCGKICPQGIQLGEGAERLPGVMRGIVVGSSPSDEEEKAWGLGTGRAVRIHSNFDIEDGEHLESGAVNKILGSRDGLIGEGPVGELGIGVVRPRQKLADMKNRVDTGKGGREGEFDSDRRDDGGDGEGAQETRAEFGGRVFQEGDVAGGQADTVPNLEIGRAAMPVGKGGLLGLGEG